MSPVHPFRIMRDQLIGGDVFYFEGDPLYVFQAWELGGRMVADEFGLDGSCPLEKVRENSPVIVVHNTMERR